MDMTDSRPDTDDRRDPAGTPPPGPGHLTSRPVAPGSADAGQATAVPGAYEADEEDQERGRQRKPGN